jgi:predicted Rossmann-fold nucleotide-binding protein
MVEEGFLRPDTRDLLIVADNAPGLLDKMEKSSQQNQENKPLDRSLYVDNN